MNDLLVINLGDRELVFISTQYYIHLMKHPSDFDICLSASYATNSGTSPSRSASGGTQSRDCRSAGGVNGMGGAYTGRHTMLVSGKTVP